MRTFFVALLKDLKRLTGVKQYEEFEYHKDGAEAGQKELNALLEPMIEVCNLYPYISGIDKQKIIRAKIISAKEFYGLNARFVKLAFEEVKDSYWKESGYLETNQLLAKESIGITFDQLPENLQNEIKEMTAKLAAGGIQKITPVNDHELKVIQTEDELRVKKTALSTTYKQPSENEILKRKLHLEWIKENINPLTKELTGMEETDWLLNKGYFIENSQLKEL